MWDYEKLGAFYLGRGYDIGQRRLRDDLVLYDSRDLVTHAVCLGMTGSGKTGLCISLLEEAAIDGIPSIVIDPKGDMANLLLTFPALGAGDFLPWIDRDEAARRGLTPEEQAAQVAERWRCGLAEWGQDGDRIQRLRDAADFGLYTPGSSACRPLSLLRSLGAPPRAVLEDGDALREKVQTAVSGLLALLDLDADPLTSRDHILLANILDQAWRSERDLDLPTLIREIQTPPFARLGVVELDAFFPPKDRFTLAMRLNNLLASPGFAAWLDGDPLDVRALLYTPQGRPRLSILSIAHLGDAERMFFVTTLLNEVVSWMRAQPGTSSLRAILYMDEVFGYLPPTAMPPSKKPLLTLLKQARAMGLGVVLATQNPVDLDYKALANAGTWFIGRLQTERDKARVLDGLEGVAAAGGTSIDRNELERSLGALDSRVFLLNDVHERQPITFQTRWTLSYLAGPLTRAQLRQLAPAVDPREAAAAPRGPAGLEFAGEAGPAAATRPADVVPTSAAASVRVVRPAAAEAASPVVPAAAAGLAASMPAGAHAGEGPFAHAPLMPPEIGLRFLAAGPQVDAHGRPVYRPALLAVARLHFVQAQAGIDACKQVILLAPLAAGAGEPDWAGATLLRTLPELADRPVQPAWFASLPGAALQPRSYVLWQQSLKEHLHQTAALNYRVCRELNLVSRPGEREGEFAVRVAQHAREQRDRALEKLRARFAPRVARLEEQIGRARERLEREEARYQQESADAALRLGTTMLGAFLGRRTLGARSIGLAGGALRSAGRAAREQGDAERARAALNAAMEKLEELEAEFQREAAALPSGSSTPSIEKVPVRPRKSDLQVELPLLVWM